MTTAKLPIQHLRKTALVLVWIGVLWNLLEAAVAIWSGVGASSGALIAFGFDSIIELFAGGVMIWSLSREWNDDDKNEASEVRARKLIGITFLLLSGYILIQSVATFAGWLDRPQESPIGIALVVSSAIVMFILFVGKTNIAKKINSRALEAEAKESLACDLQDLTLLIGLGANAILGWWWADPAAALLLIPWLVKEGREAFEDEHEHGN